jgi:hypothetical protein
LSFDENEGWFWYWWHKELKEEKDEKQSGEKQRSTYKRIKVTQEDENIPCAQCGMPLGEQGKTALVKIKPLTGYILLDEREYFCEKCNPSQI